MKKLLAASLIFILASCKGRIAIVEKSYLDSLMNHFTTGKISTAIEGDINFWEKRSVQQPDNTIAIGKLVHALVNRFHTKYDIEDLVKADSLQGELIHEPGVETGQLLTAASIKMLRHQFNVAAELVQKAAERNEERHAVSLMTSDINFELGHYTDASVILASNKSVFDYAYNFRIAKIEHYYGKTEAAIEHMVTAAELTSNSILKSVAFSNAADLYLHIGEASTAYQIYKKCIQLNGSDIHSLAKIGWIALVYDHNVSTAADIFQFTGRMSKSPESLLLLATAYELSDKSKSLSYARQFESLVRRKEFGNMYNKYLVELYTGILNNPTKAVEIAEKELINRATPQTYSWWAWSLAAAGKKERAFRVYKENVSGHRLEGMELFWMGKMMAILNKKYNAGLFFEEAEKNIYDLSPAMAKELKQELNK